MPSYTIKGGKLVDKVTGEIWTPDPAAPVCRPLVFTTDTLDQPVKSMADGNYYSSKAALRATYQPSGNPQGKHYIEVGNETASIGSKPKRDDKAITDTLHKALARYQAGERPNPS